MESSLTEADYKPATALPSQEKTKGGFLRDLLRRHWDKAAVIAIAVLLWLPRLSGSIDLRWDGSVYYLLGTSLAQGHGYRIPSEPGSPQAMQYPPLLPAFIAIHERILGSADPAVVGQSLRYSYAGLFLFFGLAALALARQFLAVGMALLAASLCLLHHLTIFLSDLLFAELPFALAIALFALAMIDQRPWKPWLRETVSFALAAAAFLLRTAGIVILFVWIMEAFLRRRWRLALLRVGLALLPVAGWQGYVAHVRAGEEYRQPAYEYQRAAYQFSNVSYGENASILNPYRPELGKVSTTAITRRFLTNLPWLTMAVGESVSADAHSWPSWKRLATHLSGRGGTRRVEEPSRAPIGVASPNKSILRFYRFNSVPILAFAVLVALGIVVLAQRRAWLFLLIVVGSVALIALTPWRVQFTRYLMPIMPFLTICAVLGFMLVQSLLRKPGALRTVARWALAALLLLTCAIHALTPFTLFRERAAEPARFLAGGLGHDVHFFAHDFSWQHWEQAADWIGTNAPGETIIATSASHLLYLIMGRRAVLPPMEADSVREQKLLAAVPVSYVIVDELSALDVTRRYALPAVDTDDTWRQVWSHGNTRIYARTTVPTQDRASTMPQLTR